MMVKHEIVPDGEELNVRIYDAPANGWRCLFVQQNAAIARYTDYEHALAGVRLYEESDKATLVEAELKVYLEAADTGKPLGQCGLASLVRVGAPGHYVYVTFTLPEDFVARSALKIIGQRGQEPIYSPGWEFTD